MKNNNKMISSERGSYIIGTDFWCEASPNILIPRSPPFCPFLHPTLTFPYPRFSFTLLFPGALRSTQLWQEVYGASAYGQIVSGAF